MYATTMVIPCRYLFMHGFAAIYEIHNFFSEKKMNWNKWYLNTSQMFS